MTTYIVVAAGGSLVGGADSVYLVGKVVSSGGADVVSAIARCATQMQAQEIVNALNGV